MDHTIVANLSEEIRATVFSQSPDIDGLHARLERDFPLSSEDARTLIYQVAASVNASSFPPLTQLELILTEGCNLACTYCFEKDMLGYKRMPLEIAQLVVDVLFDYAGNEPDLYITHFGGEPTLNFRAIQHVTEYSEGKASACGKSIHFKMTSNGVLFNESMVNYFAQHKIGVLLSIDGLESTHNRFRVDKRGRGTFERVLKGLETLKKVQTWIGVKMTVMPENAANLFNDVLGLYGLGANQFTIGYATGIKWSKEDMESYVHQLSKVFQWYKQAPRQDLRIAEFDDVAGGEASFFGCQAGRNSISVAVNGEISPCSKILALNNKEVLSKLGDVRYGLTHLHNRFELVSCVHLRSACENKGIAGDYQGGCFVENYDDNRDLFQPSMQGYKFSQLTRSVCSGCNASSGTKATSAAVNANQSGRS